MKFKIDCGITILGLLLIIAAGIISMVACYGQPYVWNIGLKHTPWYAWVLAVVGVITYLIGYKRAFGD